MKKLSVAEAEKLCVTHLSKIEDREQAEFLIWHSRAVSQTALFLAQMKSDKPLDVETLQIAGFVHDIGYSISDEHHAEHTLEILEREYEVSRVLRDCILNHSSMALPESEEGKLMQIADKTSFLNPYALQLLLKYNPHGVREEWIEFYRTEADKAIDVLKRLD